MRNKKTGKLFAEKCVPCEAGEKPLGKPEIENLKKQIAKAWEIINEIKLKRKFKFKNFKESINFINLVAKLAENEGHHPDLYIFYNYVIIELWTHAVHGLSKNDFVLAAKIDKLITG